MIDLLKSKSVITFNEFPLEAGDSLQNRIDDLKEDMLQAVFPSGRLLDIGWRPSFDPDGSFFIVVVHNNDWENPVSLATATTLEELEEEVSAILNKIS